MESYENEWGSLDVLAHSLLTTMNGFWIMIGVIAVIGAFVVITHFPPKKEY